jgi:hypothetical protein
MPAVRRLAFVLVLTVAAGVSAKSWNGIDPGITSKDEVLKRFGEPSKVVTAGEATEVLAYLKDRAIKGTVQAQFKVDVKTQLVQRIDVFPQGGVDKDAVENTYGRACPQGPLPEAPCYLKKVTDDFRVYFHYPRIGMAIFFESDGKSVNSLIFEPQKSTAEKPLETAQKKTP